MMSSTAHRVTYDRPIRTGANGRTPRARASRGRLRASMPSIHAASVEFSTRFTERHPLMTTPDKRKAQRFLTLLAKTWQYEVQMNGSGPIAERHRAQLTGAIALYREVFDVHDVTPMTLLDTYRRAAQESLDAPNPTAKEA
jgi:hypothetical protein